MDGVDAADTLDKNESSKTITSQNQHLGVGSQVFELALVSLYYISLLSYYIAFTYSVSGKLFLFNRELIKHKNLACH